MTMIYGVHVVLFHVTLFLFLLSWTSTIASLTYRSDI